MTPASERVLIVSTDDVQSMQLQQYLSLVGYEYQTSTNCAQCLATSRSFRPHLIFTDYELPDGTYLSLLEKLKAEKELTEIPVLIISQGKASEIPASFLTTGATDFIHKPIRMAELMVKIQNAMKLAQYRRQLQKINNQLEGEKKRLLRYFSQDIVEKILNDEISTELGGSRLTASILFFDLRGSTTIAEKMDATAFAVLVSEIFSNIMDIIFENHGSINKMLGDGLLAVFGCPIPTAKDRLDSVRCALAIREYATEHGLGIINDTAKFDSYGIGIATGQVFAGNIGSDIRMEYAVMGDPVYTAGRLQSYTRRVGCDILIDENTEAGLQSEIHVKRLIVVENKNQTERMPVYLVR